MNNEPEHKTDTNISEVKPIDKSNSQQIKKPHPSFKEQWEMIDELCPHCGNIAKRAEGINRQNMKRLFSLKMNFNDIMTFLLVAMLLLSVYRYMNDTAACRTFLDSGSQNVWNDMIKSGISIDSLLESSKAKTQYSPFALPNGLKNVSTGNLTGGS